MFNPFNPRQGGVRIKGAVGSPPHFRQTRVISRGPGGYILSRAAKSAAGSLNRGARRDYLERADASPEVLRDAPIESYPERWSVWLWSSDPSADPKAIARAFSEQLQHRVGIDPKQVYAVAHMNRDGSRHLHFVVPAIEGMELTPEVMRELGREVVRDLSLARTMEWQQHRTRERVLAPGYEDAEDAALHRERSDQRLHWKQLERVSERYRRDEDRDR
jgi:hypothetical protein